MKEVWVALWVSNGGACGTIGVFSNRNSAIKSTLITFSTGEEEVNKRYTDQSQTIIFTNYGEYYIEKHIIR